MENGIASGFDAALDEAAGIIRASRDLIAFTGAGISVESGIPPFRGAGGIYGDYDERHLEIGFFLAHPLESWKTIREIFYSRIAAAEPNEAHSILAEWERSGRVSVVVTQNIDGLHARAGTRSLVEFHGTLASMSCLSCGKRRPSCGVDLSVLPPRCPCGGVLKPDFVFFGEGIPPDALERAFSAARSCDVCLVVGSTGLVYPAAQVPDEAKRAGAKVIEINPERSGFSSRLADVFIQGKASGSMRGLDARLKALSAGLD